MIIDEVQNEGVLPELSPQRYEEVKEMPVLPVMESSDSEESSEEENEMTAEELKKFREVVRGMLTAKVMTPVLFATELHGRGVHLDGFLTSQYHDVPAF